MVWEVVMGRGMVVLVLIGTLGGTATAVPPILPGERPTTVEPWRAAIEDADRQLGRGDTEGARNRYQRVIEDFPSTKGAARAVQGIANSHIVVGDYTGLVDYLEHTINRSKDPIVGQRARIVYSRIEASIASQERRAQQIYSVIRRRYDSIPWWNIFMIFDKLRLRSELKSAEREVNEIIELRLLFNPIYLVKVPPEEEADQGPAPPAGGGSTSNQNASAGGGSNTNASTGNANAGQGANANTNASGNANTSANGNANGNANASASTTANTNVSSNANASPTTTIGTAQAPVASAPPETAAEARVKALKLLEAELARILALIPADKRKEAESIILTGSGLGAAGIPSSPTSTSPAASPAPSPQPPPASPAASPAASAMPASPPPSAEPTAAASPSPAAPPPAPSAAPSPAPSPGPAQPQDTGLSLDETEMQVVLTYRAFMDAMRSGDRTATARTREAYVAALEARARARMRLMARPSVPPAAPTPSPAGPGAPTSSASPGASPGPSPLPSGALVPPIAPIRPVGPAQPGASPAPGQPGSTSGRTGVPVNPATGPGGRPITDGDIRSHRGSLQPRR